MRRPTAVDPVNEMRSTRGSVTSCSPTSWAEEVTTLTMPAGMSVFSAMSRPSRVAFHGVSGAGFNTSELPVASDWPSLATDDLERVVPRHDAADHPHRLLHHLAPAAHAERRAVGQVAFPFERRDLPCRPQKAVLERSVELGHVGDHHRRAHLGHQLAAKLLLLLHDGLVQLFEAAAPKVAVGGPVGLVERPTGGGDGQVHVGRAGVGGLAQYLFGGRVHVVVAAAVLCLDELAVDQHAGLADGGGGVGDLCGRHGCLVVLRAVGSGDADRYP